MKSFSSYNEYAAMANADDANNHLFGLQYSYETGQLECCLPEDQFYDYDDISSLMHDLMGGAMSDAERECFGY